ncbi:ATP-binding protein [Lacihabitans sp. LS3-19]|uniref:ATP-binding protein n=1 Tax=Lacihabitans sp. LS3-19 TaxID=2487335 RepID=UPI0020CC3637|nr:ATP-binding protein [Lacihabitans sp. LS3-19]MCP9766619.1 ATP-binding protein [Lacihabitans sp. LS3-19]
MINRKLSQVIEEKMFGQKTILLLGARQVGKTTLLKKLQEKLNLPTLFLNADLPVVRERLSNVGAEDLKSLLGENKIVIIDEAQRIKNIGITLKIIHENFPEIQLIATGSSALELSNQINEPLTGRKWEFQMFPISWAELVNSSNLFEAFDQLESRLLFGMYPAVLNNAGSERETLYELSGSYLYKDLLSYQGIRKPQILEKLLTALAFQIGSEVSYNELSRTLEIDKATVENYISLLEKAFVIFRLNPLSRNLRNEINTSRKIYFYDNGIRNAIIDNFSPVALRTDIGALWENFLISERMKRNQNERIFVKKYFWRNHAQQEIDYIEEKDGQINAYEFKWNPKAKAKFSNAFVEAYKPANLKIISTENFNDFLQNA